MTETIRVMHVIFQLNPYGGTPVKLLYQVQGSKDKIAFSMCCLRDRGRLADSFEDVGVDIIALQESNSFSLGQIWRIAGLIRKLKIDIIHTHFTHANTAGRLAAILSGRPMIVSEHGIIRNTTLIARLADSCLNLFTRYNVSNSQATLQSVRRTTLFRRRNMRVIYNGVPDLTANPPAVTPEAAHLLAGINERDFLVLGIGSHIPIRRWELLIQAAADLRKTIPNLKVIQLGEGPESSRYQSMIDELDCSDWVNFHGVADRETVHAVLPRADIVVNPAVEEGFGIATVEAMLCSRPVICADAGSLPEIVVDRETGILIEPGSLDALKNAITYLNGSAEERARLGERAREAALESFNIPRFCVEFEDLYKSMV